MSKLSRHIISGDNWIEKRTAGVEKVYEVAVSAYGPSAGTVAIELSYGAPHVSRDGVTNLSKVYLEDPAENVAARIVIQGSEKVNKKRGDGTSAVAVLSKHFYAECMKRIGAGHNIMDVSRLLTKVSSDVIDQVDKMKVDVKGDMLEHVARISAGDEAIGAMIADTVNKIGIEGGVIVEDFEGLGIHNEIVQGIYFRKGFTEQYLVNNVASAESIVNDADILIIERPMKTAAEIAPIIDKIVRSGGKGTEVVIIGDIDGEALATLAETKHKGFLNTTLLDVPYSPMKSIFLEDLAVMTGGKVFSMGAKASDFTVDMLGGADKVIVNSYSTTIIGAQAPEEDKLARLNTLRDELKSTENSTDVEFIKDRLSKLQGKVAIVRVGGATPVERDEVRLRVDDAIAAVQAANEGGVVPGGGVCLARIMPEDFKEAFQAPFRVLVSKAGYNAEKALFKVLEGNTWQGYDLKNWTDYETVDLLEVGVLDAAEVVKEVVRSAASVVSQLITTQTAIVFVDRNMVA